MTTAKVSGQTSLSVCPICGASITCYTCPQLRISLSTQLVLFSCALMQVELYRADPGVLPTYLHACEAHPIIQKIRKGEN